MIDQESDASFVERLSNLEPCKIHSKHPEFVKLCGIARRAVTAEAERDAAIRTCAVLQKDFDEVSKERITVTDEAVEDAMEAHQKYWNLNVESQPIGRIEIGAMRAALEAAAPLMRGGEVSGYDLPWEGKGPDPRIKPQPAPAPSCPSMPEQRVSDEVVAYWADRLNDDSGDMARDLRNARRTWAASQKETRRQALEEVRAMVSNLWSSAIADKQYSQDKVDMCQTILHGLRTLIDKPAP